VVDTQQHKMMSIEESNRNEECDQAGPNRSVNQIDREKSNCKGIK